MHFYTPAGRSSSRLKSGEFGTLANADFAAGNQISVSGLISQSETFGCDRAEAFGDDRCTHTALVDYPGDLG
jgi:hypothetical protein